MKQYYHTNNKKWIIIADLHLSSFHSLFFETELVNELKNAPKEYGVIILGDFIDSGYKIQNLWLHHSQLMQQLSKRMVIWVKGNNDPISPYDGVILHTKNNTWTLEHGHKTPDWLNKIINPFKFGRKGFDINVPSDKRKHKLKKYIESHPRHKYITAHYHIEYFGKDGRISILPWKVYYLDKLIEDD